MDNCEERTQKDRKEYPDKNCNEFAFRHDTIRPGFVYPTGYAPMRVMDGKIAYWMEGEGGLTTTRDPPNVTAVYGAGRMMMYKESFYDSKFNLHWPLEDSAYQIFARNTFA
jgi:hypothetical protein